MSGRRSTSARRYRYFIGIDPGKDGGIAVLNSSGRVIELLEMPSIGNEVDRVCLSEFFGKYSRTSRCFIEKIRPGKGARSMLSYGMNYGCLTMGLVCWKIPFEEIQPVDWKRHFNLINGKASRREKKKLSILRARELFPEGHLPKEGRIEKDGIAEALLIAEYGRQTR